MSENTEKPKPPNSARRNTESKLKLTKPKPQHQTVNSSKKKESVSESVEPEVPVTEQNGENDTLEKVEIKTNETESHGDTVSSNISLTDRVSFANNLNGTVLGVSTENKESKKDEKHDSAIQTKPGLLHQLKKVDKKSSKIDKSSLLKQLKLAGEKQTNAETTTEKDKPSLLKQLKQNNNEQKCAETPKVDKPSILKQLKQVNSNEQNTTVKTETAKKPGLFKQVSIDQTTGSKPNEAEKKSGISKHSLDNQPETTVVHTTQISVSGERMHSVLMNSDSWIMSAIPYLPLKLAVVYLILNIFLPGTGTILSGFSILCCGKCRVQTKDDQRLVTLCVNACVGVSQLFTVTFLLVGWFWSIAWGLNMVLLAVDMKRQKKEQRERDLQANVLNAFGNSVPMRALFPGIK